MAFRLHEEKVPVARDKTIDEPDWRLRKAEKLVYRSFTSKLIWGGFDF